MKKTTEVALVLSSRTALDLAFELATAKGTITAMDLLAIQASIAEEEEDSVGGRNDILEATCVRCEEEAYTVDGLCEYCNDDDIDATFSGAFEPWE